MKIMICGSLTFAKEMLLVKKELEKSGHQVILPLDVEVCINNPKFIDDLEADLKHCINNNILKKAFGSVKVSEAILVLNYPKNGIKGYIGTSTLMEMGIAHFLNKKIFLLNPIPPMDKARWALEVNITQPVILNGDLSKIN